MGTDNGSDNNGTVYTPREFAVKIGRSVSTLRNWERQGHLKPGRYPSGQKFYTESHVVQILGPIESDDLSPEPTAGAHPPQE